MKNHSNLAKGATTLNAGIAEWVLMTNKKTTLFDEKKFRETLPAEMLKAKRWMRFFLQPKPDGKTFAKIPLANHADESTWSTFDDAVKALEPGKEQGLGYAFYGGDIHGLDIDHCRNAKTGQICNEAMLLLSRLPSWSEYSVSGQGIHVLFKGNVRGKQLGESCLQYWNSANSPRYFALTCEMVGQAFTKLKDVGEEANYVFATARHISAKIREELATIDPEQYAALPVEREPVELVSREKAKHKTRKVAAGFDIKDFLAFYGLRIDNETDNELGHCIRLTTCPLKGDAHVGHNSTTCNFIYPCKDGGIAFHCQSTGCCEYGIKQALEALAKGKGPYPKPIYEAAQESGLIYLKRTLADVEEEQLVYLWQDYLPYKQLVHFMGPSSEGKSPVSQDLIARITSGACWPNGAENTVGPRSVILMSSEDGLSDTVKPRIRLAGGNNRKVYLFEVAKRKDDLETPISVALDRDMELLKHLARSIDDLALIVIDPITNYLGKQGMNNEAEIRSQILMPLVEIAQTFNVCVVTIGHLNKREAASVLQKGMGATAFTGVPRKVFLFGGDPEDSDKYTHVMNEVRDKQTSLKYKTVKAEDTKGIQSSGIVQVDWLGEVERDADEMVNQPKQREKSSNAEAKTFIKAFLRDGAKPSKVIEDALKDAGIDCPCWQRVAGRIPAKCQKLKGKNVGYEWYLSTYEQTEFDPEQRKPPQNAQGAAA